MVPWSFGGLKMRENTCPSATEAKVRPIRKLLKKDAFTFGTCMVLVDKVFAHKGGGSPWTQAVQALPAAFTGPIATVLALVAIVVGGPMFVFGESAAQRRLAGVIFGVGM